MLCKHGVMKTAHWDASNDLKAAFHDTDTDADILARIVARMSACRATFPFSLPQEQLHEIARVGHKDVHVGVSGESVSVSMSGVVEYGLNASV